MKRERGDTKIIPSAAYNIAQYDNVFIVLKGFNEVWKNRILWSEEKKKFFLKGKIIEWLITTEDGQHAVRSYPLNGSVSFVEKRDWKMYSTCKWDKAKEEKIMHIHYSWIDYILLDFNSLDWKR